MPADTSLKATDRCVMCGLCLPHCPTYTLTRDEGDSPRGRIALMRGLDTGEIPVNEKLLGHLDRCLECGACEAMCPSEVPFTQLMDTARARVAPHRPEVKPGNTLQHRINTLLSRPRQLQRAGWWLRAYQHSGLQWLARNSHLLRVLGLHRLDSMLPPLAPGLASTTYRTTLTRRGAVALFTGCVSAIVDTNTQRDTIKVLNLLGFDVEIPAQQVCCGALHQHNGEPDQAAALAKTNLETFDPDRYDAIIATASGCSAQLSQYELRYGDDNPLAQGFQNKAQDITHFLARVDWPVSLRAEPLPETVAVHDPCTLRNSLKQHRDVYRLLQQIPGLQTVTLNPSGGCCGAAGSYFLTQPDMATALRQPHMENLATLGVRTLASSNIGCALQLAAGIREAGLEIEMVHPVTLLARQLS